MTSEAQVAANRRNARKSTGPKTAAGKRRVSQNAQRHGILSEIAVIPRVESRAKWKKLVAALHRAQLFCRCDPTQAVCGSGHIQE